MLKAQNDEFVELEMKQEILEADVVIVGSGMGGATTAYALAQKGVHTLVLERGDRLPKEVENWSPEAIFIDTRYKPDEKWVDEHGNEFVPGVHYFVGGNTKVYGASLPRFREKDFEEIAHHEGTSPAWPFKYRDIEPYYLQAEKIYKVHGNMGEDPNEPPRSEPFPYPALEHEPYIAELAKRLRGAGVTPYSNAMGINLGPTGNCIRCGTCDGFVCKIDAKGDAEISALNPALTSGNVQLRTSAKVKRIELAPDGKSVHHLVVEGIQGDFIVKGKKFVLAAGCVNTAALLLASKNPKAPNGVANSSDLVGRNFMMHNNAHIAAFSWKRKNDVKFQKTLSFADWYFDGGDGYPLGAVQLIGKVQGIMMKSYAKKVPLTILNFIARRSVEFVVMAEDLPDKNNRVTLDEKGRIKITRHAVGVKTHRILLRKARQVLRASGYLAIFTQPFDISMNSHQCGTTVAGNDPKISVVDQYCKAHDLTNLYLIDGGFFPSSAAMNPALTIAAQALRVVAESDLTHFSNHE
ncbi:MAG: GMC family oxidoreductase [Actinomycetota bacterium]